jgi:hypothetical protein
MDSPIGAEIASQKPLPRNSLSLRAVQRRRCTQRAISLLQKRDCFVGNPAKKRGAGKRLLAMTWAEQYQ